MMRFGTILLLVPALSACGVFKRLTEDDKEEYRHCELSHAVNDAYAEKADGYTVRVPGEYQDLLIEQGATVDIYDEQKTESVYLAMTLKSASREGHFYAARLRLEKASGTPVGAPVKELKAAAYIENAGPVDPAGWEYYDLGSGTIEGTADSKVESTVFKLTAATAPIQLGYGAGNHSAAFSMSTRFSGTKTVTNVIGGLEEPDIRPVTEVELALNLTCETKTVDDGPDSDDFDDDDWDD